MGAQGLAEESEFSAWESNLFSSLLINVIYPLLSSVFL